jgi:hypothetical protein
MIELFTKTSIRRSPALPAQGCICLAERPASCWGRMTRPGRSTRKPSALSAGGRCVFHVLRKKSRASCITFTNAGNAGVRRVLSPRHRPPQLGKSAGPKPARFDPRPIKAPRPLLFTASAALHGKPGGCVSYAIGASAGLPCAATAIPAQNCRSEYFCGTI